jgi:HlyD family secretion protein
MFIVILVLIAAAASAGGWYWHVSSKPQIEFKNAKVQRGDLLATISATGTIEPEEVVDIGAQVTGPGLIVSFGKDTDGNPIDYRSTVKAGQLLAKIDETTYKADRDTAAAQLDAAQANLEKAKADVEQTTALANQAEKNWARAQKVGPSEALSKNDYDMYEANFKSATANVGVAKAEVHQAQTGIAQGQATLAKAQRNLDFCTITSPVDGIIIARRVNVGQTVVAGLNAPSLFLIGKDLTRMRIWVAVNEADIGQVHPKQNVSFTCDAFQGEHFKGTVNKIRLNATMTSNVVTYTVEVNTDNADGRLLPYMTANVQFEVSNHENVLMVPNSALRWYPSTAQEVAADVRSKWKPVDSEDDSRADSAGEKTKKNKKPTQRKGTIWLAEGKFVRPSEVVVGPTDGLNTEVTGEGLKEGQEIVDGEIQKSPSDSGGARNPFLPQIKHH